VEASLIFVDIYRPEVRVIRFGVDKRERILTYGESLAGSLRSTASDTVLCVWRCHLLAPDLWAPDKRKNHRLITWRRLFVSEIKNYSERMLKGGASRFIPCFVIAHA